MHMHIPAVHLHLRIPRLGGSAIEADLQRSFAVLDGRDVTVPNRWKLEPHTVALIGRPAVSFALAFATPPIPLGLTTIRPLRLRWEEDFGGHLFIAITGADADRATILEAGPMHPNGTGALVPYCYPEDSIADREGADFPPIVISPPNGLTEENFAQLVRSAQKRYDGDQRYTAIQLAFLFVGRDSNSYVAGVLLCSGVDPRDVPKPHDVKHFEWAGYPGLRDPVHASNFGIYASAPVHLDGGALAVAYHADDGDVLFAVVGGEPNGNALLPDGTQAQLDDRGRIVFTAEDARNRGLPVAPAAVPAHIRTRRRFPDDPAAGGGLVTLVVAQTPQALEPGARYRGRVVDRQDALGLATMRTASEDVVLPMNELGVELRDPKRVDALFDPGNELTVGLARDRHPKLVAHRAEFFTDRLTLRRFHAPRRVNVLTSAAAIVGVALVALIWRRSRT